VDVIPQSDHTKPSGSLKISSDPTDALVLLDGNPMGNTDMETSGIDIGKRKLELKKDCFETKTTEVFIKANQQVILNLKLKPSCGAVSVKPPSKYSKLDSNGKQLPDSAQSWVMVLDNETNFIWEVKQNKDGVKDYDNPNDADNTYNWVESNQKFVNALNAARLGGFSDWRLPSLKELKTLVDSNRKNPAISADYFPNTQSSLYWTSTTYASSMNTVWCVNFFFGLDQFTGKHNACYVRAVHVGQ
jgi:hypothetical protein